MLLDEGRYMINIGLLVKDASVQRYTDTQHFNVCLNKFYKLSNSRTIQIEAKVD